MKRGVRAVAIFALMLAGCDAVFGIADHGLADGSVSRDASADATLPADAGRDAHGDLRPEGSTAPDAIADGPRDAPDADATESGMPEADAPDSPPQDSHVPDAPDDARLDAGTDGGCTVDCPVGARCTSPSECCSGVCTGSKCAVTSAPGSCCADTDCCSGNCQGHACQLSMSGGPCCSSADCMGTTCNPGHGTCK